MVVVLPAPFGPSSPTSSPRPTVRLRPSRAVVRPYDLATPTRSIAGVDTLAVTGGRQGSGHRSQRRRDGEVRDVRHRMPMVRRSGNRRGRRARRVRVRRVRHPRRGRRRPRSTTRSPAPPEPQREPGWRADRRDRGEEQADGRDRDAHQRDRRGPAGQVDQRATDEQADRLKAERDRPRRAPDASEQLVGRMHRAQREVRHQHHRLDDPGDERDRELDRDLDRDGQRRSARCPSRGCHRGAPRRPGRARSGEP